MSLYQLLQARAEQERPVRVVLIGAGKFGSMFLAQVRRTPGLHILGIADLSVERARKAMHDTGWDDGSYDASSAAKALSTGSTFITDDACALINAGGVNVVIEATGVPEAGIKHATAAIDRGRHVVMVNVEADALVGPLLAKRARQAGVVYSMAYGDQPALIAEQVNWARTSGFEVVAAGKGTLYMPEFHASTPDTVWDHYGIDAKRAARSGMNAKMFNSFLDGTKSGLEMAAVANACGLRPAQGGLKFPPCQTDNLAEKMITETDGGVLAHSGQVEVVSSRDRDGCDLENDLRWGVYVTYKTENNYVKRCFKDYGLPVDASGAYSALWRPCHLIGLELGVSVASVALLNQPTGVSREFNADVVATAKRDLKLGEVLDGEGGFMVWGRLMASGDAMAINAVPIGLAHMITLTKPVALGEVITWSDVDLTDEIKNGLAYVTRLDMQQQFAPDKGRAA